MSYKDDEKRNDSRNNSKLITEIILATDGLSALVGGAVNYQIFKTSESFGYGFLAGATLATLGQLIYFSGISKPNQ